MKNDKIILFVGLILICAFLCFLPRISELTRNTAANNVVEEEKIPTAYTCERDYNENGANVKQMAKYTLKEKEITAADINRAYTFSDSTTYNNFKKNVKVVNATGITDNYQYDDNKYMVTETIGIVIGTISKSDLSNYYNNFPTTYENLLKYTQGQKCDAVY